MPGTGGSVPEQMLAVPAIELLEQVNLGQCLFELRHGPRQGINPVLRRRILADDAGGGLQTEDAQDRDPEAR